VSRCIAKFVMSVLIGLQLLATAPAQAQVRSRAQSMPSEEAIAHADNYQPQRLTGLAAKLAQQPDITGTWMTAEPLDAPVGQIFDPEHAVVERRPLPGEVTFGPLPGTYDAAIPYNEKYRKIYQQHIAEAKQGHSRDTFAACVPYGLPRVIGSSPGTFDIIQAPEVIFWYAPYPRTERRIFLDGRAHPGVEANSEPADGPTYSGHSIGHWEGNTLVVDTVNMIPSFFDETGAPHSDQMHVIERLRLIDDEHLQNEMTLIDPVAFTHPWVLKRYYKRLRAHGYLDLADRPCTPNVRIDENGFQVALLPQEIEAEAAKAQGKPTQP